MPVFDVGRIGVLIGKFAVFIVVLNLISGFVDVFLNFMNEQNFIISGVLTSLKSLDFGCISYSIGFTQFFSQAINIILAYFKYYASIMTTIFLFNFAVKQYGFIMRM
jgi:hypothetical protein